MRTRRNSDAFLFSLSEFAFILLFVLIAFGVVLFTLYAEALTELSAYEQKVEELNAEVAFLSERLAELEGGVVPCWRRPDQTIPRSVGRITIHTERRFSIDPPAGTADAGSTSGAAAADSEGAGADDVRGAAGGDDAGGDDAGADDKAGGDDAGGHDVDGTAPLELELEDHEELDEPMRAELRSLLDAELSYAAEHNCYLRLEVENETDEFSVYRSLVETVRRLGIVVAQ